jgi:hypothetical protein
MPDWQQSFQILDPFTGAVTNNFQGHITAEGFDIAASPNAAPDDTNRINWITQNGWRAADLSGYYDAIFGDPSRSTSISLSAYAQDLANPTVHDAISSHVKVNSNSRAAIQGRATIEAQAQDDLGASAPATIIGANGISSFLQLLTLAKRTVAFGVRNLTFNNVSIMTDTFGHGLPSTPLYVFAQSGDHSFNTGVDTLTATQMRVVGRQINDSLVTGTFPFYWLAIS